MDRLPVSAVAASIYITRMRQERVGGSGGGQRGKSAWSRCGASRASRVRRLVACLVTRPDNKTLSKS
jgi:hypothetical protein